MLLNSVSGRANSVRAGQTPAEFAAFVRSETIKMKKVIDLAGVRAE